MKSIIIIPYIFILLNLTSCYLQKTNQHYSDYKQLAYSRFGKDTLFIYNPAKTYVLCSDGSNSAGIRQSMLVNFFIYHIDSKLSIYQDKLIGAKFKWISDSTLIISEQKGIINSHTDKGKNYYLYNVISNQGLKKISAPVSLQ